MIDKLEYIKIFNNRLKEIHSTKDESIKEYLLTNLIKESTDFIDRFTPKLRTDPFPNKSPFNT